MNNATINSDVTMAGGGQALLANRYRVVKQLGQGGMGSVWLAEDTVLDNRKVAIKMLPSILFANKRAYNQLKSEALVAMKLSHQNIASVRFFEENNGNPFIVEDYIEGQTLDDYLAEKGGTLSEDEMRKLLEPVAAALDYAHREGVVHRDVKPSNIMIRNDGRPYLLDFGVAREIQETMTLVTGQCPSGTLLYMSPEQLRGQLPHAAQDVYSFAAVAYECLKGAPPFSRGLIEYQILNEQPENLPHQSVLASIVMKGLSKSVKDRPVDCSMFFESELYNVSAVGSKPRSGDLREAFERMLDRMQDEPIDAIALPKPIEILSGFRLGQRFVESELEDREVVLKGNNEGSTGLRIFGLHTLDSDPSLEMYLYEDLCLAFLETTLMTNTVCGIVLNARYFQDSCRDIDHAVDNLISGILGRLEKAYGGKFKEVPFYPDDQPHWYLQDLTVKKILRLGTDAGNTVEISICESLDSDIGLIKDVYVSIFDDALEKLRQEETAKFSLFMA